MTAAFLSLTRSIARWMLLLGMFACLAFSIASANAEFISGSVPLRAAIAIWLPILVKIAPRLASFAPFSRLIVDHLLCPDIAVLRLACCYNFPYYNRYRRLIPRGYYHANSISFSMSYTHMQLPDSHT